MDLFLKVKETTLHSIPTNFDSMYSFVPFELWDNLPDDILSFDNFSVVYNCT